MDLAIFQAFFDDCVGNWEAERTYHYLTHQEVERSRTTFQIRTVDRAIKTKVLADNQYDAPTDLDSAPGYHLDFQTVSEKGEKVAQSLNFLFVPDRETGPWLSGTYLRDRAYEEDRPAIAGFRFHRDRQELLMTTHYAKVVSVDSILLVNPTVRVRRILNYLRPDDGVPLDTLLLAGFGVEQKTAPGPV